MSIHRTSKGPETPPAERTYLSKDRTYVDREVIKKLGAVFDGKLWYVPSGRDLTPFERWLPAGTAQSTAVATRGAGTVDPASASTSVSTASRDVGALAERRGIPLSELMGSLVGVVARAFRESVWTIVEVASVRPPSSGHIYFEVTERNAAGQLIATARAKLWKSDADRILPRFEKETGIVLGAGIKLLMRARPEAHKLYGLSLTVDDIDPAFTLGDLEARRREIRARLTREGVFGDNKALEAPWDYRGVLVVAPEQAAGLGDFRREADRLEHHGVCRFSYAHAVFQGEGAVASILAALDRGLDEWMKTWQERRLEQLPDAICIIRGGGSASDLAWLDRYELANWICRSPLPVLTGIGHERDSTVLDEVAHCAYDTPSKAILGIESLIRCRVDETKQRMGFIVQTATQASATMRRQVDHKFEGTLRDARLQVHRAGAALAEALSQVRERAPKVVGDAAKLAAESHQFVRSQAGVHLATARQQTPALLESIAHGARQAVQAAASNAQRAHDGVLSAAQAGARLARKDAAGKMEAIGEHARRLLRDANTAAEAHMREIVSQGPRRTLRRGFAVVRSVVRSGGSESRGSESRPITSADAARLAAAVVIEFHDGQVSAQVDEGQVDESAVPAYRPLEQEGKEEP